MKKIDALIECLKGKKIRHPKFVNSRQYIYWNGQKFIVALPNNEWEPSNYLLPEDCWQILPELVSFDEAIKAYKAGRTIRALSNCTYSKNTVNNFSDRTMLISDILSKWQIIND